MLDVFSSGVAGFSLKKSVLSMGMLFRVGDHGMLFRWLNLIVSARGSLARQ